MRSAYLPLTELDEVSKAKGLKRPVTTGGNPFLEFQQELSDMFEAEKIARYFRPETEGLEIEKPAAAE